MINIIDRFFVKSDNFCDYIPIISSASNLTDLFQKFVVLPFLNPTIFIKSDYYIHLREKSTLRCVVLLIPIIGNIIIALYDLSPVKKIKLASDTFKCDEFILLKALEITKDPALLQYASLIFRNSTFFMFQAFKIVNSPTALSYATDAVRGQKRFMIRTTLLNEGAADYAFTEELKRACKSTNRNATTL